MICDLCSFRNTNFKLKITDAEFLQDMFTVHSCWLHLTMIEFEIKSLTTF